MVADRHRSDLVPDLLYHAGGFVPQDLGENRRMGPVDIVQVAMAQSDHPRTDLHFSRAGIVDPEGL
jgi:hypothetical protein